MTRIAVPRAQNLIINTADDPNNWSRGSLQATDAAWDADGQGTAGEVVVAAVDGELTVKRLLHREGRVFLAPENPQFEPIDITESEFVHIWGVVTYVIHKL